jgi:hypothetical protein
MCTMEGRSKRKWVAIVMVAMRNALMMTKKIMGGLVDFGSVAYTACLLGLKAFAIVCWILTFEQAL